MKIWKYLAAVLVICLLGTAFVACGDEAETTPEVSCTESESTEPEVTEPEVTEPEVTEPEETEPEATEPEETEPEATEPEVTEPETTEPETTEPVCKHLNMTERELKAASCSSAGKVERKCADCGYLEEVMTDFAHQDRLIENSDLGAAEYICDLCGNRAVIVDAGRRVKLAAYCEGDLSFDVRAVSADQEIEVLLDGESRGNVTLNAKGKGSVRFGNLEKGGYSIVFVNKGSHAARVSIDDIDGHFSRPGAVYVEVLGKGGLDYSSFNVYIQTSDPSEEYYICYYFTYKHNTDVNNFKGNSLTNTEFYRVNGANLYRIIDVDDTSIQKEKVEGVEAVLGGGEISFAVMQQYPYLDELAEGAKVEMGNETRAMDYIGGFHGDEWMSDVLLVADGEIIDLQSAEPTVIPCSTVTFDLTATMVAWGTSKVGDRGVPVAEHIQNFVMDSTGVVDVQTIKWLRDDFVIHAAYLPMFTMMRGKDGNRLIDTMRAYDADGNLLEEYVMEPEYVYTKETQIMMQQNAAVYEYLGDKGVSSTVGFKALNEQVNFPHARINIRSVDNKLYVAVNSATGGNAIPKDEVWKVELAFKIDYIKPVE